VQDEHAVHEGYEGVGREGLCSGGLVGVFWGQWLLVDAKVEAGTGERWPMAAN
jgi:hypothetical protein